MFITATAIKGLLSTCAGLGFIGVVGIAIAKPEWLGIPQYNKRYVLIVEGSTVKGVGTVFNSEELDKLTGFKCALAADKEDTNCTIDKVKVDLSKKWVVLKDLASTDAFKDSSSDEAVDFFYRLKVSNTIGDAISWNEHSKIELLDTTPKEDTSSAVTNKSFFMDASASPGPSPSQGQAAAGDTTGAPSTTSDVKVEKPKVLATITPQFSIEGKSVKNNGYFGYIAKAKTFTKAVAPTTTSAGTTGTGTGGGTGTPGAATALIKLKSDTSLPSTGTGSTPTGTEPELNSLTTKKHYFKCSESAPSTTTTTTETTKKSEDSTPASTNPQCWISNFSKYSAKVDASDYKSQSFHFAKNYSTSIEKGHLYVIRYPHQETPSISFTTLHMQVLDTSTRKPVTEGVASIEFENIVPVFIYPFGTKAMAFDLKKGS